MGIETSVKRDRETEKSVSRHKSLRLNESPRLSKHGYEYSIRNTN